jgi:hypothetical protein
VLLNSHTHAAFILIDPLTLVIFCEGSRNHKSSHYDFLQPPVTPFVLSFDPAESSLYRTLEGTNGRIRLKI